MFLGEYSHNIDDKNRLAIPAKFRPELKDGAVITRGLDNCLFLFTKKDWRILAEKLAQLPLSQANARSFARMMLMGAMEVGVDKLGRILIPDYLKKFAELKKQVVIGGVLNRIEIWDENKWQNYKNKAEEKAEEVAEGMRELGI
ncbi:division/cell wall cluster transcriptional repressor MraZ [Candidatus Kuenenbacteria bacterium]|nr:division/cell wall cluster transcriptional repressor MraZ [Candidatus Kuenenbacteria bacterium]